MKTWLAGLGGAHTPRKEPWVALGQGLTSIPASLSKERLTAQLAMLPRVLESQVERAGSEEL